MKFLPPFKPLRVTYNMGHMQQDIAANIRSEVEERGVVSLLGRAMLIDPEAMQRTTENRSEAHLIPARVIL
jgi:hypothetical protein